MTRRKLLFPDCILLTLLLSLASTSSNSSNVPTRSLGRFERPLEGAVFVPVEDAGDESVLSPILLPVGQSNVQFQMSGDHFSSNAVRSRPLISQRSKVRSLFSPGPPSSSLPSDNAERIVANYFRVKRAFPSFFPLQDWRKLEVQFPTRQKEESEYKLTVPRRTKRGLTDPGFSFFPRKNWRKFELEFQTEKRSKNFKSIDGISKRSVPTDLGFSFFPRREWESSFKIPNAKKIEIRSTPFEATQNEEESNGDFPSFKNDCGTENTRSLNPLCLEVIFDTESESSDEENSLKSDDNIETQEEETQNTKTDEPSDGDFPNFQDDCGTVTTRILNPLCLETIFDTEPESINEAALNSKDIIGSQEKNQNGEQTEDHSISEVVDCSEVGRCINNGESENEDSIVTEENTLIDDALSEVLSWLDAHAASSMSESHVSDDEASLISNVVDPEVKASSGSKADDDEVAEDDAVSDVINLLEEDQSTDKTDLEGVGQDETVPSANDSLENNFQLQPEVGQQVLDPNFVVNSDVNLSQPPVSNFDGNSFSGLFDNLDNFNNLESTSDGNYHEEASNQFNPLFFPYYGAAYGYLNNYQVPRPNNYLASQPNNYQPQQAFYLPFFFGNQGYQPYQPLQQTSLWPSLYGQIGHGKKPEELYGQQINQFGQSQFRNNLGRQTW